MCTFTNPMKGFETYWQAFCTKDPVQSIMCDSFPGRRPVAALEPAADKSNGIHGNADGTYYM